MPQSTVADSIIGALGNIGGIGARRESDGLTATQAHGKALENKKAQLALDREEERITFAEMDKLGIVRENVEDGSFDVDYEKLLANPELAVRVLGPEANKFLKTNTDGGPANIKLAGIKKAPGALIHGPTPIGGVASGQSPDRYIVELATEDGRIVPATENATADPSDKLITLDGEQIKNMFNARVARMQAGGAADNSITMGRLGLEHKRHSDAYLQNMLAQDPDKLTGGDPVAGRDMYSILSNLQGEELNEAVRDAGFDPEKLREEAAQEWAKKQGAIRTQAVKTLNTEDQVSYRDTRTMLDRNVSIAKKALADYDAKNKNTAGAPSRMGGPLELRDARPRGTSAPKVSAERAALAKNLAEAEKAVAGLAKPKAQTVTAEFQSGYKPPFEWNEQNLRDTVLGKLQAPTAEQTAALAKYARDQGVTKAADLAKLPRNDAMALATIIAANTQGTSTEKLALWEKLTNFARTGDPGRSPIDANVDIAGAQAQQGQAITAAGNLDQRIVEHSDNMSVKAAELGLKAQELNLRTKELASKLAGDNRDLAKDIDKAHGDAAALSSTIRLGIMNDDLTIKPPTKEAMDAWHQIQGGMKKLPLGSPKQIALSGEYLDSMFNMAAAQSLVPGQAAWWDFPKQIANLIFREKGQMNMSPMIETARIEWKDGRPERVSFTDSGSTGKESEMVVGAAEFERFTGTSSFTDFVNAVIAQKAATMLDKQGVTPTPQLMAQAIAAIKAEAGAK